MASQDALIEMDHKAKEFLDPIYDRYEVNRRGVSPRIHVTLTFAQSTDAKIAGKGKKMLPLSGKASMMMTHRLRAKHDAILVGIGTLLNDDPQLNGESRLQWLLKNNEVIHIYRDFSLNRLPARLLPDPPAVDELPVPVVLDGGYKTPLDCKLIKNFKNGTGRRPVIISCQTARSNFQGESCPRKDKLEQLEKAGFDIIEIAQPPQKLLHWPQILSALASRSIKSVMIEGGATVISSLMACTPADSLYSERRQPLYEVDTLIITVSPTMVGTEGVAYEGPDLEGSDLVQTKTEKFGKDVVFVWEKERK